MRSLTDFLTRLMPKVPGCPEPTALQALLDAATEFSDRTRAIRLTTEPMVLVSGQAEYDLDLPTGVEPVQYVKAWVGSQPLLLPPDTERLSINAYVDTGVTGTPIAMFPSEESPIRLYPAPDERSAPLTVRLAVRPTQTATQVMDVLFTRWRDAIIGGAAYRLAATPAQAYTNAEIAIVENSTYQSGVSRARMEANRDMVGSSMQVQPRPFA